MTHVPAPESTPEASQPESGPVSDRDAQDAREAISERCGFTVIEDGDEEPCDRPAPSWRWYQGHFHEDTLDHACELHENEGGRRMATLVARVAELEAERGDWQGMARIEVRVTLGRLRLERDEARRERDALRQAVEALADEWESWGTGVVAAAHAAKGLRAALAAAGPAVSGGREASGPSPTNVGSDGEGEGPGFPALLDDGTPTTYYPTAEDECGCGHSDALHNVGLSGWCVACDCRAGSLVSDGEGATSEACPTCGSTGDRTTFTDGTACYDDRRPASPVVAPSATDEEPCVCGTGFTCMARTHKQDGE